MPSSTAAAWPSPGRFALALIAGFGLTLIAAWLWGTALIEEAMLPLTRTLLGWIDDRFGILFLGIEHNWQDTVVRLRVNVVEPFVMGGQVIEAHKGWLEVTTTIGAMLQPAVIGPAIAFALPGPPKTKGIAFALATLLAFAFLLIDLPLTLHAYVWDMFVDNLEPDRFSPLMAWHRFLHAGGRLGIAMILGVTGWWLVRRKAA